MAAKEQHAELVAAQRAALNAASSDSERAQVLAEYGPQIGAANSRMETEILNARPIRWHAAPDGTECCCTAEDRRYGCGCR